MKRMPPARNTELTVTIMEHSIAVEGKKWVTVVGTVKGKPVASCDLLGLQDPIPYINGLSVLRGFRSNGNGSKMIRACIDYCRTVNKVAISLNVSTRNKRAIKLYRRLGFVPATTGSDGSLWMTRQLNDK